MLVGYARTSTIDQEAGFEAQIQALKAMGCEKVYQEQVSSVGKRTELEAALDYIRDEDVLVVTKLDRLARSTRHLGEIVESLKAKNAELRILNMNLDTSTPTGKLLLDMLGAVAEFERSMMLERQKEGIAKAKANGKYKGRAPTAKAKAEEILKRHNEGQKAEKIAADLQVGRSSVFRIIKEHKEGKQ